MLKHVESTWHMDKCYLGASYDYYDYYCYYYYLQLVKLQKVMTSIHKLPT